MTLVLIPSVIPTTTHWREKNIWRYCSALRMLCFTYTYKS